MLLLALVDIVRADEAQVVAEPCQGFLELRRVEHAVRDPLHARWAFRDPHQLAGAGERLGPAVDPLPLHRDGCKLLHPVDHLDLVAVRLGQPHALTAAGLIEMLDPGRARCLGQTLEIVLALGVIGKAHELRIALFGDVDMVRRVGAAHVERGRRARGAHQSEPRQKFFRFVEVGRAQAPVRHVRHLDVGHLVFLPDQGT